MALGDFLRQKYLDLIQPVQQSLSNVGNNVSSAVQNFNQPRSNVGGSQINLTKFKPVLPTPQVNSNYYQGLKSLSNYQQGVGDYLQNRVVEPIKAAKLEFSKPGIVSKGLGALNLAQAGYNLTPVGIGTNIALGAGAGALRSARTSEPLNKTASTAITQNISPTAYGTGTDNPYLSMIGDVVASNPQSAVNAFTKVGKLTSAFRKTPPTPPMHGEDVYYLDRAIDALRDRKLKGTSQRQTAVDIIDKLAEGYLPKNIIDKTKGDTNKLIKQLQKKVGNYGGASGTERIPGLGLVESKAQRTTQGAGKQLDQIETGQSKPVIQNNPLSSFLDEEVVPGGSGKTPNLPPRLTDPMPPSSPDNTIGSKGVFEDWVNSRRAVSPEQAIIKQQFGHLDNEGVNAFFNIQKGDPKYAAVRQYLDSKFEQVKKVGMDLGYESDYLPQVWANSDDEIAKVFGKRIVTKPGFTLNKIIDDYKMGIEAGLTPKFEKVSDLLAWYEGKVSKSIADRNFFNSLHKSQTILPIEEAPKDWITLNPDRFPKIRYTDANGLESREMGPFKAPREIAESINNYLYNPEDGNGFQRALNAVANYVSRVKNIALSFGIPGTAVNAHGVNILTRHTLFGSGGNPITRLATGLRYLIDPYAAQNFLQKELTNAPQAVKAGLTLSTEDFKSFTDVIEKTGRFSKLGKTWNTLFEKRLFDQMIPALKLSSYQALEKQLGTKQAANLVNNVYGGINWEAMGRNRDFQNFLRAVILAPDWAETTVRVGANLGKSLVTKGPVAARYRTMITTLIGAYVSGNIANKLSSGHYMWENDPGHTFEIEAGYTNDGQKRYFKPFGTALDMVRIPYDISLSLAKGDLSSIARIFRNRLSIPAGVGVGFITDTNYAGQPIGYKGKDKFGNEMPLGQRVGSIAGEAAQLIGFPSFLRQAIDTTSGKQGVEQGLTQGFELPFRYSGGAYSKSQQAIEKAAQSQGVGGKELYDLNKKTQGVTLSKNQTELIKQGGVGMVDDILQLKSARSQENQLKDTVEKMQTGELSEEEGNALIEKILQSPSPIQEESSAESITPAHASNGYPAGSLVSDTSLKANSALPVTSKTQASSPFDEQKISLIKAKLKYGGSITNDEKQLVLRPPQPLQLTGQEQLDKQITSEFNNAITSKQAMVKDLYSAGVIKKEEAEKYLKDFTAMEVSTKDQLTAEKQQIDAQYSLDSDMLKRSKDTQTWISTTEEYVKYLENYKSKLTDPTAQIRVQNRIEDLKTQLSKYTKQGGFTKGRKLKTPKIKAIKIKMPKIKAVKAKSIKLKKVKEYKLPRVKALKSARIKVKSKLT